jgi:hypothetical protein
VPLPKRQRVNHRTSTGIPAQRLGGPSPSPASPPPLGLPPPSSSTHEDEKGELCRGSAINFSIEKVVNDQVPNAEVTAYGNGFQVMAPESTSITRKRRITVVRSSSGKWLLKHMKDGNSGWQSCCDNNIPPDGKIYPNLDEVIAFINRVFRH